MAELVDAQVSGTCDRKVVEVRVFFWAPNVLFKEHSGLKLPYKLNDYTTPPLAVFVVLAPFFKVTYTPFGIS